MNWLIDGWFPYHSRSTEGAPEGAMKTFLNAWRAVCIASGYPYLGHEVMQGPVVLVDGESPPNSLETRLDRFAWGLGYKGYKELPITVLSQSTFKFGRKTELDSILRVVRAVDPVYISFDSMIKMLPTGRQGLDENNSKLGTTIGADLDDVLNAGSRCSTHLLAHSRKQLTGWTLDQFVDAEMQDLIRGHGSIVGEACDTGFGLFKISEAPSRPTRCVIVTKPRRWSIPVADDVVYAEIKEETYGMGWARIEKIDPVPSDPSDVEKDVYKLLKVKYHNKERDKDPEGMPSPVGHGELKRELCLYDSREIKVSLNKLVANQAILNGKWPAHYIWNPNCLWNCHGEYLGILER